MALPAPGQKFEDKYLVDQHIGSGGFAEVFKAHDDAGRAVAIKVLVPLHAEWAQNDPIVERFEREGKLLGHLKNEHTVSIIAMGRTSDDQSPYIIFEYIDGADLAEILETKGPLPARRVVKILQQVCSALAEAHDLGVMHRDIKPANIMVYQHLGVQGLVKLLDFGIAKPTGGMGKGSQDLTSAGVVLGTPRYMAPEQFTGARAAPSSDIYSLGLVAYELIVGRMAVDAETTTGIFRQQLSPVSLKIPRSANIPAGLRRVITKMTRKTRSERYQTVQEVLNDLSNLDRVAAVRTSRRTLGGSAAAVLGVAVLLIAATGVTALFTGGSGEEPVTVPDEREPAVEEPAKPEVVARIEPKKPPAPEVVPEKQDISPPPGLRGSAPAPARFRVPTDAQGKPMPPPEDEIEAVELSSSALVKTAATQALTMGDWDRVIAVCKPRGAELTFCARWLADAYRSRGNKEHACYWFEVVGEKKTGLKCPYEEKLR